MNSFWLDSRPVLLPFHRKKTYFGVVSNFAHLTRESFFDMVRVNQKYKRLFDRILGDYVSVSDFCRRYWWNSCYSFHPSLTRKTWEIEEDYIIAFLMTYWDSRTTEWASKNFWIFVMHPIIFPGILARCPACYFAACFPFLAHGLSALHIFSKLGHFATLRALFKCDS